MPTSRDDELLTLEDIGSLPFAQSISNSLATSPQNAPGSMILPGAGVRPGMQQGPVLGQPGGQQAAGMSPLKQIAAATGIPEWQLHFGWGQEKAQNIMGMHTQMSQQQQGQQRIQLQQQQVQLQQKQYDLELGGKASEFLYKLTAIPKVWRPYYIDQSIKSLKAAGVQGIDDEFGKQLKKADDEETREMAEFVQWLNKAHNMGLSDQLKAIRSPEIAFKYMEEYRKMKEMDLKQKEFDLFREAEQEPIQTPAQVPPATLPGRPQVGPQAEFKPLTPRAQVNPDVYHAVDEAARKYEIRPALFHAMADSESSYDPSAVSPKGAQGVLQLMPSTQKMYKVADPFNPMQNADAGAKYFSQLLKKYGGNEAIALAAYNAGEQPVDEAGGKIPNYPETQNFVKKVMAKSGRPYPMTVQEAPKEYQGQAVQIDQRIQKAEALIERLEKVPGDMADKKKKWLLQRIEAWRRESQTLKTELKPEGTPEFKEFTATHPEYAQYNNIGQMPQDMRVKAKIEFDEYIRDKEQMKRKVEEGAKLVPNPEMVGEFGVSPTTTVTQLEEMIKQDPSLKQIWRKADDTIEREMANWDVAHRALTKIEPMLRDPKIAKWLGSMMADPEKWMDRTYVSTVKGLPPEAVDAVSRMAGVAAQYRAAYAGLSQTASETENLKPLIPVPGDPGDTALSKVRSLINQVAERSNAKRDYYRKGRYRLGGDYLKPFEPPQPAQAAPAAAPMGPGQQMPAEPPQAKPGGNKLRGYLPGGAK